MAHRQFITFKLGDDMFGIDILFVREVNRSLEIRCVDRAPYFVKGLINLRGQIVTVLDVMGLLGIKARTPGQQGVYIVLKSNAELERLNYLHRRADMWTCDDIVGLYVDEIGDVISAELTKLQDKHDLGVSSKFLEGILKLDNQLLPILKPVEILSMEQEELLA